MTSKEKYTALYPSSDLPYYLHPDWLDIVSTGRWEVRIHEPNGRPPAVFLGMVAGKFGFRMCSSLPFTPYSGFYFLDRNGWGAKQKKKALDVLMTNVQVDLENFTNNLHEKDSYPYLLKGYDCISRFSYIMNLENGWEQKLERRLAKKIQENTENIEVRISQNIEGMMDFYRATFGGKPVYDPEIMRQLYRRFSGEHLFIMEAHREGKPLGCVLIGYDQNTSTYLASGHDGSSSMTASLLLYNAMKECEKMGIPEFDFHGSSQPSIERFMRKFGAERSYFFLLRRSRNLRARILQWRLKL